ncbi:hypothetical protein TeGR_g10796, partial [Tetraparma gracilis]
NVQHFLGSPRLITVAPAATDPDSCVVKIPGGRSITAGSSFEAVVKPFDEFQNPTSHPADSFKSRVELGSSDENFGNRHVLPSDHTFAEMQTVVGAYKLYLYHANTQTELAVSPIGFDVVAAPPSLKTSTASAGNATSIETVTDTRLPLQVFLLDDYDNAILDSTDVFVQAMKKAMEEQKEDRKDELRTVLIPSSEIDIVELLGQGGMGKVHLANYKQKLVAVKQLITINDDSVMRFRRECFLTKEMSHPNIVILIGVCWDTMMLGCVLEYVNGGSLQDRLKADWNADFEDKITWKGELLKWAREAALGCQYLHHKRYFDETIDEWKEGIVHRDLKPDNMLVTTEGVLKLTDFGEARTAEVDMTMTAVGTPIFLCPEIIRGARY